MNNLSALTVKAFEFPEETAIQGHGSFLKSKGHASPFQEIISERLKISLCVGVKVHSTEVVTNHFVQLDYLQVVTGYLFPVISIIYLKAERLEAHYSLISNQYTPYSYSRK